MFSQPYNLLLANQLLLANILYPLCSNKTMFYDLKLTMNRSKTCCNITMINKNRNKNITWLHTFTHIQAYCPLHLQLLNYKTKNKCIYFGDACSTVVKCSLLNSIQNWVYLSFLFFFLFCHCLTFCGGMAFSAADLFLFVTPCIICA